MSGADAGALRAWLERALRELLGLDPELELGRRSPLELGLTSLGAMTLQYRFEHELGADVALADILGAATLDELAAHAAAAVHAPADRGMLI